MQVCVIFIVRCLIVDCVNVIRIAYIYIFFHVGIPKNLGFCGVLVVVVVVMDGFWWLG